MGTVGADKPVYDDLIDDSHYSTHRVKREIVDAVTDVDHIAELEGENKRLRTALENCLNTCKEQIEKHQKMLQRKGTTVRGAPNWTGRLHIATELYEKIRQISQAAFKDAP